MADARTVYVTLTERCAHGNTIAFRITGTNRQRLSDAAPECSCFSVDEPVDALTKSRRYAERVTDIVRNASSDDIAEWSAIGDIPAKSIA